MTRLEHRQITIDGNELHVVTSGDPHGAPYVFLHGWPESWSAWHDVVQIAGDTARCIAIDLPGIGASRMNTDGSKRTIAGLVHGLIERLELADATLVGHDVGGMVAYAYLRAYTDVARVAIVNIVIPGVAPWDHTIRNPKDWHWAFHATPHLPEILTQGKQLSYFAFFYDLLAADPAKITPERRAMYAAAYGSDAALQAGFDFYRAMEKDALDNAASAALAPCDTPLLYIRGDHDQAPIEPYVNGFRDAGIRDLATTMIPNCGHFIAEEAPEALWRALTADHRARRRAA
jgi:pimeloyl-ACP methyl ester carboxylesterase